MNGMNKVLLLGNLGNDPELRGTAGGSAVLKFSMATTESYLDRDNTRQERTEWHRITVWGKRGEALAKLLSKGDRVLVEGGIRTSSYEKDGEKRYSTEIHATDIFLCGGARGAEPKGGGFGGGGRGERSYKAPEQAEDYGYGEDIPFIVNMTHAREWWVP